MNEPLRTTACIWLGLTPPPKLLSATSDTRKTPCVYNKIFTMGNTMKIDLKVKKTEAGWQKAVDDFWLKATPKLFEWLSWVLILGVFTFLDENYEIPIVSAVIIISYLSLLFYLQSFFFSIEFHGVPFVKSDRIRRLISLLLSGILSYSVWLFLYRIVSAISGKI